MEKADIEFKIAYKQKLLETYDFTVSFLERNNLRWWGGYGTVLGAVRHKGLIPWDDDIDLIMPREDYEKLLLLRDQVQTHGFDVLSSRNGAHCNSFIKICNCSTSLVSEKNIFVDEGVFVDIFPMDNFSKNYSMFIKQYNGFRKLTRFYKLLQMDYLWEEIFESIKNKDYKHTFIGLATKILPRYMTHIVRCKIEAFNKALLKQTDGKYYVSFYGPYGIKEMWDKRWFEQTMEVEYEGRKIKIPMGYDEYLRNLYNNYMTPPNPIPEYTHSMHYVNLKKRLSQSEIREHIKRGVHYVY